MPDWAWIVCVAAVLALAAWHLRCLIRLRRLRREMTGVQGLFVRLFRLSPDAMAVTRARDGVFLEVNDSFCRLTGWPREELIGRSGIDRDLYAHPGDRDRLLERLRRDGQVTGLELEVRHRDGHTGFGSFACAPIVMPDGDINLVAVVRDVTERRRQEAALLRARAFERLCAEIAARLMQVPEEAIEAAAESALGRVAGFIGVDRAAICLVEPGRRAMRLVVQWAAPGLAPIPDQLWDFPEGVDVALARLLPGRPLVVGDAAAFQGHPVLVDFIRSQGVRSLVNLPLLRGEALAGFLSLSDSRAPRTWSEDELEQLQLAAQVLAASLLRSYEERERRLLEGQLRHGLKMEALGRLAGGVAHDFNNALAGILGCAQLLANRLPEGEERGYALSIATTAERAGALPRRLLAFARRSPVGRASVDLHQILRETVDLLGRTLGGRIELKLEPAASRPVVEGDAGAIQHAILNLALNARDAMPEGGSDPVRHCRSPPGSPRSGHRPRAGRLVAGRGTG